MLPEKCYLKLSDNQGEIAIEGSDSTLMLKFKVKGLARFISHAETLRMLRRAFIRAEINLSYSGGFNPRPHLSLPLPRSVGLESDDELCIVKIAGLTEGQDICSIRKNVSHQLPDGFELNSAEFLKEKLTFAEGLVTYAFKVKREFSIKTIKDKIQDLLAKKELMVNRCLSTGEKIRRIDVRIFLHSIDIVDNEIIVCCKFGPSGTIRIDEIMQLLDLSQHNLAVPVRRVLIDWRNN